MRRVFFRLESAEGRPFGAADASFASWLEAEVRTCGGIGALDENG